MSKYIGTPVVNLSVDTVDVSGDITATDSTPELILLNDTHEDTDGGREGKITFKGEQSGGEVTVLGQIQSSHDGTSDDQKGDLIFKTNDGSDGASPTERMRIDSAGKTTLTGTLNGSGDFTIDADDDLILESGDGDIKFTDSGTEFLNLYESSNNAYFYNPISDADIIFQGKDGGSSVNALTLDMSDAGTATFNHDIKLADNSIATFGASDDLQISHDAAAGHSKISDTGTGYLVLTTSRLQVNNAANNQEMLIAKEGDAVELFHNNVKKFETTNVGVKMGGTNPKLRIEGNSSSYYPCIHLTGLHGGLGLGTYFGGNISGDTVSFRTGANTADGGTEHFRIAANGDLTATDTSIASNSDERLKENIVDYAYDIAKFKQYEPKTFDWKNPEAHNGRSGNRGFIAQAVKAIDDKWVGEANVTEENPDYDIISDNVSLTSKLGEKDAMYISIIQQLITKIETLETKVAALEGE